MDETFPQQLFPHYYLDEPPETKPVHSCRGWGSYERVFESSAGLGEAGRNIKHQFESQHNVRGDQWVPVKAAVTPLIPPCEDARVFSHHLPDPMEFPEHMQYFYKHHYMDAFSTMGHLLQDHYSFKPRQPKGIVPVGWVKSFIKTLNYGWCYVKHPVKRVRRIHHLLTDVLSDIPSALLGQLLHEELTSQREQQQFNSDLTGGALGYVPLNKARDSGDGCLIFRGGEALDQLNFHRMVPEYNDDKPPSFSMDSKCFSFDVNGTIRQLSLGNMEAVGNVGVRSDYFCSVWLLGDDAKPRPQEVIQTKEKFSCITVSPHVPDELVVATEQGTAYLWRVKKGLEKFREQHSNLYFNAKSSWRWCEFSCHPKVMVFADRTGAELTDARNRDTSHTLFRIGKTPDCVSGERVMLCKYLSESHAHHHLISTQFSTYIMDERVPCVPMLKWNHMMDSEPQFVCVLPGLKRNDTCKVLLGAQKSQEIMLLQYKGGREHVCQIQGPIQKLFSPRESLSHLNSQLPHRRHLAQKRLNVPAAGLTAIQNKDYVSVFQLTETGDIFFQTLKLHKHQASTDKGLTEPAAASPNVELVKETVKNVQSTVSHDDQCDVEARQAEVIDNVDNDHPQTLGKDKGVRPAKPSKDPDLQVAWDQWFKPIFKNAAAKKRHLRHQKIRTNGLINLKDTETDKLAEDRFKSLRRDLHDVMRRKELIIRGGTYLPHLDVIPVPDPVDPTEWPDDLSQRLSASWEGKWENWWEEKLGLNREKKIRDLRRKRRREKQARARSRLWLSGSFTSSVSYQDNLSVLSSAPSQYLSSDEESLDNSQATKEDEGSLETEMQKKPPAIISPSLNDQQDLRRKRRREKQARALSCISSVSYQDNLSVLSSALSQYLGSDDESLDNSEVMKEDEGSLETEKQKKPAAIISPSLNDQQTPVKEPMKSALRTPQRPDHEGPSTSQSKYLTSFNITRTLTIRLKRCTVDLSSSFCPQKPAEDSEPDDGCSISRVSSSSQLSMSSPRSPQVRSPSQRKKARMGF